VATGPAPGPAPGPANWSPLSPGRSSPRWPVRGRYRPGT